MVKCEKLLKRIDELEEEYIKFWFEFASIESPTSCKEAVDRAGEYVMEKARKRGWDIEIHEEKIAGNVICITMNKGAKGKPIALSAHMDTVHPIGLFGNPPVKIEDGKIYGPGVMDCKGGLVSAFMAMAALEDVGFKDRPVLLLLQSDEEVSSRDSKKGTIGYMCEKAKDCVAFLNGEGHTNGHATIIRKGIMRFEFTVTGKSVHSSNCPKGKNAIAEAAMKILELEKMKNMEGLTCNCGMISGGTAENTVPEKCIFTADIRYLTPEEEAKARQIVQDVADKSYLGDTTCSVRVKSERYSMPLVSANEELLKKMNEIYKANGLPVLEASKSMGGSDTADTTHAGIPSVDSLGTTGGSIHSRDEYSDISSLTESAKRYAAVVYCFED